MFIGSFLGLRAFILPPFITGCRVPVLESCFCIGGKKATSLVPGIRPHQLSRVCSPLCSWNAGFSSIPEDKLSISFSRSSGAGGQNVNKVNTKVEVRFNLSEADWLENDVKERLRTQLASRITRNGDVVFTSQEHRTQLLNRATAIAKLQKTVMAAMVPPKERRLKVGISMATKLRRKEDKRRRKEVKANRSKHRRSFDDGW